MMDWLRERVMVAAMGLLVGGVGGAGIHSQLDAEGARLTADRQIEIRVAVEALQRQVDGIGERIDRQARQIDALQQDVKMLCRDKR